MALTLCQELVIMKMLKNCFRLIVCYSRPNINMLGGCGKVYDAMISDIVERYICIVWLENS